MAGAAPFPLCPVLIQRLRARPCWVRVLQGALITPPSKNEYDQEAFERMHAEASMASGKEAATCPPAHSSPLPNQFACSRSVRVPAARVGCRGGFDPVGGVPRRVRLAALAL